MNIVVLAGGLSPEREVSLTSGSLIANALMKNGHAVCLLDLYLGTAETDDPLSLFRTKGEYHHTVSTEVPDLVALKEQSGNGDALVGKNVLTFCRAADVVFLALHGGMGEDGRTLVTKNSFRMLNTLYTLGSSPEPNLTILWSTSLPENFKKFCAKVSADTDSIQYENDDVMRPIYGDDYAIACCVSAMKVGKQMQFFGARCNLAKLLLLTLNGGYDTTSGIHIGPQKDVMSDEVLDFDKVKERFDEYVEWLMKLYVNTMNVIHYMHDKYAYEKSQMALHDTDVERFMAFGVAGLSVITDSLSAIKYATVKPIRDENGFIVDFETEGEFPKYGNDDDRVDLIARDLTHQVITELRKTPTYRNAIHTLSVLTITSNVAYGKKTGATPDGRKKGEPFAPGANPMHNREENGALASLNSIAKLSYDDCRDGISNTFSITPNALGKTDDEQITNLVTILDGYFAKMAHHINVNVMTRETLMKAYENPEAYPNLTIRVSGYAVHFNKLSREQQREVISRTFHEAV